jgi:hypothetical protein
VLAQHAAVVERHALLGEVDDAVTGARVARVARDVRDRREAAHGRLDDRHRAEPLGRQRGDEPLDERGVGPVGHSGGGRGHQVRLDRDGEVRTGDAGRVRHGDRPAHQPRALQQPVQRLLCVVSCLDEDASRSRFGWTSGHAGAHSLGLWGESRPYSGSH